MIKTNIVTYPAVFVANDDDSYTVTFPDVNAATTTGQDLGESLINATTVLGRYLQDHQNSLPDATTMTQLQHQYPTDFIQFVAVDLCDVPQRALPEDADVKAAS